MVWRQAAVREGVGQVRRRQPLWPDRRQRLRQVHLHEDPRRRPRPTRAQCPSKTACAWASCARINSPTKNSASLMWCCKSCRDVGGNERARRDLRQPGNATEDDYMRAAELEGKFAEYDGYTAEARAGELLMGVGIPVEQHFGPMSEVAPAGSCACCWRRRCFQPGHPAAGRTDQQPGHQHHPLAGEHAEPAQLHHDHHLARPPLF